MSDTRYLRLAVLRAAPRRDWQRELDAWAQTHIPQDARTPTSTPHAARWCAALGDAGWLRHAVAGTAYGGAADVLDTRALCLMRETLARHSGLADFAFAMQGLGSGAISLHGSAAAEGRATCRAWRAAGDRRLRAVRARRRLRRGRDALRGARRRRPLRAQRREDLDLQRRHRRLLRGLRAHRRGRRARAASRPSSSMPARPASRSPSAST